jgi:hypothetical protein
MNLAIARRVFLWICSAGLLASPLTWTATSEAAETLLFGVDVAANGQTRVFRYPRDRKGRACQRRPVHHPGLHLSLEHPEASGPQEWPP